MLKSFARAGLVLAAVALAMPLPGVARAAPVAKPVADAGTWDLIFEKGNRRCRLFLRSEPHGDGLSLATTSVCHKAFPTLSGATSWVVGAGNRISIRSEAGQTLMEFMPDGTGSLAAVLNDGDTYQLTPISPAEQERLREAAVAPPGPAPGATGDGVMVSGAPGGKPGTVEATAMLPPTTAAEVAGNYAVLRQDRDTGCMVSLLAGGKGDALKARLAPACRDQGIVIFDPAAWKLVGGTELVLTAKRGHSTALKRKSETSWANTPARGAPLVLKRL